MDPLPLIGDIRDLCSAGGFQWEFGCKRCHAAYRSELDHNIAGQGRGLLRMAGQWFGGDVARAAWTADSYGGGGYSGPSDSAKNRHYAKAVEAVLPNFRHCPQCSQWQCAQACWNGVAERCVECSPLVRPAVASANITRRCGSCGNVSGGKFCQHCGSPIAVPVNCGRCGTQAAPGAAFCAECGNPLR
jgi:hypothetical protein